MNEGKMFSPEEQAKLQKSRTVNDAELINGTPNKLGGADYVPGENGPRLELEKWQIDDAKKEMIDSFNREKKEMRRKFHEDVTRACDKFDQMIVNNEIKIDGLSAINSKEELESITDDVSKLYVKRILDGCVLITGPFPPRDCDPGWEWLYSTDSYQEFSGKNILFMPYKSYDALRMNFVEEQPETIEYLKKINSPRFNTK